MSNWSFFSLITSSFVLLLTGCQSYTVVQRNVFSDEDGNLVTVDYGRSESEHTNTFRSPATGQEMEFKSKLVVKVQLPDGDKFTAWQCMNFLKRGTMYKTDNEEWMTLMNGFSCTVYHQTDEDETRYLEVYRGVLCDTPKVEVEKDERWKVVKPQQEQKKNESAR